jgi:prepilin-type N-terminal cleavage/methylation domain-containing protein
MDTLVTRNQAGNPPHCLAEFHSRSASLCEVKKTGDLRQKPHDRRNGFSLIELLITIVVIAIVIAVALPNLTSFNQTYRIRNDADRLASLVNLARMRAVGTFARVEVFCGNTTNQCALQSKPYSATVWAADANHQAINLSPGVSFGVPSGVSVGVGGQSSIAPYQGSKAQAISYAMIFNSRGLPIVDNTAGTAVSDYALYLVGPNNTAMAVSADASGKSYIYTLDGSSWVLVTD